MVLQSNLTTARAGEALRSLGRRAGRSWIAAAPRIRL